jgi:hypothetical protein
MPGQVLTDRFYAKCAEQTNGCVYWAGARDGRGYGLFRLSPKRIERAHRVALRWSGVSVEPGDIVMHACDTPACVNPEHLSVGTIANNNADRDAKGRYVRLLGEAHGLARFTRAEILAIRASAESNKSLGLIYNCRSTTIGNIRARRTWRHI